MAGLTTAMTDSYRLQLMTATHDHTITTGHVFKVALFKANASISGTFGKGTTNYSDMSTDELATATGYTQPGFAFTAAQNITPTIPSANTATTSWSTNPNWTSATFITRGCLIYNSTGSGKAVSVHDFTSDQTVTAQTMTLVMPANTAAAAILRLA